MAQLCNMTTHININDVPILPWKGQTFSQITSLVKQNQNQNTNVANFFNPNPLKHYRREIITNLTDAQCNSRKSSSIDEINRPGGSLVSSDPPSQINGLVNTLDINLSTNTTDRPSLCSSCDNNITTTVNGNAFSPAQNALRRVRSSGMVKREFDISTNKPKYYTNTNQYLYSRNRTQEQNAFHFILSSNSKNDIGNKDCLKNAYAANGSPDPNFPNTPPIVYYKPNNPEFAQQGAVTSSSHITRVKYNSITNNTNAYRKAFGTSVANALAYGVSDTGYTLKDIIGYPNTVSPVFTSSRN